MPFESNLEAFEAEVVRSVDRVKREHERLHRQLCGDAFRILAASPPVITGLLRSATEIELNGRVIATGLPAGVDLDRPDPFRRRLLREGRVLPAPEVTESQLAEIQFGSRPQLRNRLRYASSVDDRTQFGGLAADAAAQRAEVLSRQARIES